MPAIVDADNDVGERQDVAGREAGFGLDFK